MISETDVRIVAIAIALAEVKEHDAPWLKNAKSVVRDATGRFASKSSSSPAPAAEKSSDSPASGGDFSKQVSTAFNNAATRLNNATKEQKEFVAKLFEDPQIQEILENIKKEAGDLGEEGRKAVDSAIASVNGIMGDKKKSFDEKVKELGDYAVSTFESLKDNQREWTNVVESVAAMPFFAAAFGISALGTTLGTLFFGASPNPALAVPILIKGLAAMGVSVAFEVDLAKKVFKDLEKIVTDVHKKAIAKGAKRQMEGMKE